MIEAKRVAEIWIDICEIYSNTREKTPKETMTAILNKYNLQEIAETFAAITKLKEHDGRIYGRNREEMEIIPTDPVCREWNHNNPLLNTGKTDYIHTAHINQLISELLRRKENAA